MVCWPLAVALLVTGAPMSMAEERCRNPPPVFDCGQWHWDDGRLVTNEALTAGLLGLQKGSYIGDKSIIDGLDYGVALKQQCGDLKKHGSP